MESDQIIKQARTRFDHAAARRELQEKYETKMLFAHGGGMWRAGPELLSILLTVLQRDWAVILDLYGTPVRISPIELQNLVVERWQEQMNAWLVEFETLAQQR